MFLLFVRHRQLITILGSLMPLVSIVFSRQHHHVVAAAATTRHPAAFLSSLIRRRTSCRRNTNGSSSSRFLVSSSIATTRGSASHVFGCSSGGGGGGGYRGGATTLVSWSSSSNDDNNDDKSEDAADLPDGRTGWTHNQPNEESAFWGPDDTEHPSPINGEGTSWGNAGQEEQDTSSSSSSSSEPRTGWLHNAEPTPAAKAISKQEKQQTNVARRRLEQAMKEQEQNHRMLSPPSFHACGEGQGCLVVTEHMMSVPLDRNIPRSPRIDLYFTITEKVSDENRMWLQELGSPATKYNNPSQQRAKEYVQRSGLANADGMALYLQGGPGFGSPTPMVSLGFSSGSSWAAAALDHYDRVVLMDQRGTGRSTAITKQTLEEKFPDLFLLDGQADARAVSQQDFVSSNSEEAAKVQKAVEETTEYMAHFRANNIVLDAEEMKDALMVPTEEPFTDPRPWGCALGQSFGGFCMLTYLSQVSNPPRICLLTGGIAPMLTPAYDAYTSLWGRVKERSLQYYEMYPGDVSVVKTIVQKLLKEPVKLPSGGTFTARRFLQLGLALGGSPSAFASFHAMLSSAMVNADGSTSDFTRAFLKYMDSAQSFDDRPIYFWLHESIYGDGPQMNSPTDWAAHRAYEALSKNDHEYDYKHTSALPGDDSKPTLFFGEMVFPWMPEDFEELSGVGLQAVANTLATKTDWGNLYDGDHMRKVLGDGTCKAAAAVYHDDMYVDIDACLKVAARGGPLEKCKVWVTNDFQHSGLRDGGSQIYKKLHGMATGAIRTPS